MKKNLLAMVAVALLGGPMVANAVPMTWNLDGVTFNDGGTATGYFIYDADLNAFSGINITTSLSANGALGTTYGISTGIGTSTFFDTITSFPAGGQPRFLFDLLQPMTNLGGTIGINLLAGIFDGEGICTSNGCGNVDPFRTMIAGRITTVPEPATLALFGLGLVGLGFARRRRATN